MHNIIEPLKIGDKILFRYRDDWICEGIIKSISKDGEKVEVYNTSIKPRIKIDTNMED